MDERTIQNFIDPKTFQFQFWAIFVSLFILTKLSCTIGCTITTVGTAGLLLVISWKFTKWLRRVYFREKLSSHKKAVLVTGCDTGFGNGLAIRLNNQGYTVYAACLDPNGNGLQQLLKTAKFSKAIKLIALNVTSETDVERLLQEVKTLLKKDGVKLWAIVNNAGIFKYAHIEWGKLEDFQQLFDINVIGTVRVTRAFLPLLRETKGRVVNVASIAGRLSAPGLAIYSMSKHAVIAFSTALRREMLLWGVKVSTVEPSTYKTPMADPKLSKAAARKMWDESLDSIRNAYGEEYFDESLTFLSGDDARDDPEEVVDAMFDAISDAEPDISYRVCGLNYAIVWYIIDYLPYSIQDAFFKWRGLKVIPTAAKNF